MDITCSRLYEQFKVYINGQLHLQLKTIDLIGFQSWIHGEKEYFIEYYFTTGKITTAYGEKDKWIKVLELLDKHLTVIG
jgi:hypothetical protein